VDAAPRRFVEVDVVRADREVGDGLDRRRGVEQLRVDALGDDRQQRVGLGGALEQDVARRRSVVVPEVDLVLRPEPLERWKGERARDENLSHGANDGD
jgi:hypothetical protein